ncbi:MAG: hypothetical protein ACK53L_05180, partial [Pirellulaceae bacterium]
LTARSGRSDDQPGLVRPAHRRKPSLALREPAPLAHWRLGIDKDSPWGRNGHRPFLSGHLRDGPPLSRGRRLA